MTTTSADPAVGLTVDVPAPPRRSLLGDARAELSAIRRYRSLLRYLVSSSVRAENSNTVFGYVWWVLDPLLLMLVYVTLVQLLLKRGTGPDFAIFILTAIICWELFSKGVLKSVSQTIAKERSMRQVSFPKSVLPLSTVISTLVAFGFGFAVLLVVAIPFGIYPNIIVVAAVPVVIVQLAFTLGLAFFLSAFNVFFRDTTKLLRYTFRIWFYLSPALYPVTLVPERFRDIYELNPFATFFPAYRSIVMDHQLPDFAALGWVALASAVVLVLGFLFFVRVQPWFAKLN